MAIEQDMQALMSALKALADRVLVLESMIGGPRKSLESGGNSLVIGPQGIEIVSGSNLRVTVGTDYLLDVSRTASVRAGGDYKVTAGGNAAITVSGSMTETVGVQSSTTVGGQASITVGANLQTSVGGTLQTMTGMDTVMVAGKDMRMTANRNLKTEVKQDLELAVQKGAAIQAGDDIVIKTGATSIVAKKDGNLTIKGKDISIDASGKVSAKASSDIVLKGAKILQN